MRILVKKLPILLISVLWVVLLGQSAFAADQRRVVVVYYETDHPQIEFAVDELAYALAEVGFSCMKESKDNSRVFDDASACIYITVPQPTSQSRMLETIPSLDPQGYAIRDDGTGNFILVGGSAVGCMYGGLELAERIRLNGRLDPIEETMPAPSIQRRGIKFNIPLDARTPSYDDTGDAAQNNIAEMWNFEFWRKFLDSMARHRYNTLTLWNPHPFPSIVKLPNYPDVALEDICVTTLEPTYEHGEWRDPQFVPQKVLDNLKVVRRMTIDEKIDFWRKVMQYARNRGIDIYFITWNIIMNSVEGKYGITTEQDNRKTIAYLRESVRETILTYPLLTGVGVTAGENMKDWDNEYTKEKWLWKTYGLGIMDAKEKQPGRTVRFIHRVWYTGLGEIMREFGDKYPDSFEIGFKYARAHMYSSTDPVFADPLLKEMEDFDVKCWWNLRNDDIFNFRWGNPEYVRAFLKNLPPEQFTAGYHMGSDGYVWGREFTSLEPENPRLLEIEKHWYKFLLWGRMGYDLNLSPDRLKEIVDHHFPSAEGTGLYETWAEVSKIIPQVNRFHWRNWDFMWAVEGCFDQRNGFHTVRDFINNEPMEGTNILSIPEYVDMQLAGQRSRTMSPISVAANLQEYATVGLSFVERIRSNVEDMNRELRHTVADIEAMSHLGNYYASKIRGAVELHLLEKSGQTKHKNAAVKHLLQAQEHWKDYAGVASKLYKPQLLARTRVLDWWAIFEDVKKDVEIARKSGSSKTKN